MKKSIFRILILMVSLVFVFTLVSCSENPKKSNQNSTEEQEIQKSQSETEKDKTSLLTGNEGPTNVTEGKDCLHQMMENKTYATDGCGHHIYYEECSDCGYKHVFDYDYFWIEDKSATLGDEEKDKVCKICGITLNKELVSIELDKSYNRSFSYILPKNINIPKVTQLFLEEFKIYLSTITK